MRLSLLALLWVLSLQPSPSFTIVPGDHFGAIRESTTRQQLNTLYGRAVVVDQQVYIGEGFCTSGTAIFKDTTNEIELGWQDKEKTRVAFVRTLKPGGSWRTARGVRIGTLLTELERLSGSVLTFNGFAWDYGGGLLWKEGKGELHLQIGPDAKENAGYASAMQNEEIIGDRTVRSDHPVIRSLKVRVEFMTQNWGSNFDELDCR